MIKASTQTAIAMKLLQRNANHELFPSVSETVGHHIARHYHGGSVAITKTLGVAKSHCLEPLSDRSFEHP